MTAPTDDRQNGHATPHAGRGAGESARCAPASSHSCSCARPPSRWPAATPGGRRRAGRASIGQSPCRRSAVWPSSIRRPRRRAVRTAVGDSGRRPGGAPAHPAARLPEDRLGAGGRSSRASAPDPGAGAAGPRAGKGRAGPRSGPAGRRGRRRPAGRAPPSPSPHGARRELRRGQRRAVGRGRRRTPRDAVAVRPRVDFAGERGVCLTTDRFYTTHAIMVFDGAFEPAAPASAAPASPAHACASRPTAGWPR